MNCKKCKSSIDSNTSYLTCCECNGSLHLQCITSLKQSDYEFYQSSQKPWKCLVCEKNKSKRSDETPVTPSSVKNKLALSQSENSDSDKSEKSGGKKKILCGNCKKGYSFNAHRAECAKCKITFHFKCLNTTKDDFDKIVNWQCTTCCGMKTPCPDKQTLTSFEEREGSGIFLDLLNEMKLIRQEIKKTNETYAQSLEEFRQEVFKKNEEFTNALNNYSDWVESNGKQIKELTDNIAKIMKDYEEIRQENINLKKTNDGLIRQINSLEQSARDKTVEIHGIPFRRDEKVIDVIMQVAQAVSFDLKEEMVDTCYRLRAVGGTPPDRPAGIIVRFVRRIDKETLIDLRRKKRNLNTRDLGFMEGNAAVVYVNDSLTPERRKLFNAARDVKREKEYTFLWVKNGKIFMRKNQGDRFVVIESHDDLKRLM